MTPGFFRRKIMFQSNKGQKVVVGLSGGMDSTTLAHHLLHMGCEIHPFVFTYGSKHNKWENQAAQEVHLWLSDVYGELLVKDIHFIDISNLFNSISCGFLKSSEQEIPEGHYAENNMKQTVVPGRNLIFTAIMASYAESINARYVALAIHAGDHHIYPDCRPQWASNVTRTINTQSEGVVRLYTPFIGNTKQDILNLGYYGVGAISTPYSMTRTCYKDQPVACGKCGSCQERLEAFHLIGQKDPIKYEHRELLDRVGTDDFTLSN